MNKFEAKYSFGSKISLSIKSRKPLQPDQYQLRLKMKVEREFASNMEKEKPHRLDNLRQPRHD
jgi:hypothetical protein